MIDYKLFQFASAPLTGVDWIIRAAQLSGLGPGFSAIAVKGFGECNGSSIRLSSVRNPCDWLAACWEFLKNHDRPYGRSLLPFSKLKNETFEQFVGDYLKEFPGWISKIQSSYRANVCLRYEDLPWSFVEFGSSVGIEEEMLDNVKRWMSRPQPSFVEWNDLRSRLLESEEEFCERYDYY